MTVEELKEKIKDIVIGITNVKNQYVSEKDLVLDYVTIFSHSNIEFKELVKAAQECCEEVNEHNGPVYILKKPMKFRNGTLKLLRIRKPDSERPQVGCGDFKVSDYKKFRDRYLKRKNFVFFDRKDFEFIGIHDPDKDYLVYFPDIPLSEDLGI